jgi:hypothetical protein
LSTPSMSNQITFQLVTSPPLSLSTMSMELWTITEIVDPINHT